jgi:hypothetical protein
MRQLTCRGPLPARASRLTVIPVVIGWLICIPACSYVFDKRSSFTAGTAIVSLAVGLAIMVSSSSFSARFAPVIEVDDEGIRVQGGPNLRWSEGLRLVCEKHVILTRLAIPMMATRTWAVVSPAGAKITWNTVALFGKIESDRPAAAVTQRVRELVGGKVASP